MTYLCQKKVQILGEVDNEDNKDDLNLVPTVPTQKIERRSPLMVDLQPPIARLFLPKERNKLQLLNQKVILIKVSSD